MPPTHPTSVGPRSMGQDSVDTDATDEHPALYAVGFDHGWHDEDYRPRQRGSSGPVVIYFRGYNDGLLARQRLGYLKGLKCPGTIPPA